MGKSRSVEIRFLAGSVFLGGSVVQETADKSKRSPWNAEAGETDRFSGGDLGSGAGKNFVDFSQPGETLNPLDLSRIGVSWFYADEQRMVSMEQTLS